MRTVFAVFKRDLLRILRNPIALAIALGIAVVPCLYAWINIIANHDPYANTSDVRVAVVNEDTPVAMEGMGDVCVGNMMEEALHDNHQIGWTFVDEDDALNGVQAGKYYAAIVISPEFTSSLTNVLEGNHDKARLKYYVNEKVNAIAPKVTDTGATTLETQINDQFMGVVSKVVIEKLQKGINDLVNSSQNTVANTSNVLNDAKSALSNTSAQLSDLTKSLEAARAALGSAANTASSLRGSGSSLANSLSNVPSNLSSAQERAEQATNDLNNALTTAAATASALSTRANTDITSITTNIASAQAQVNTAIATLESDLTDTKALESSLGSARDLMLSVTPAGEEAAKFTADIQREINVELDVLGQLSQRQQEKLDDLRDIADRIGSAADTVTEAANALDARVQGTSSKLLEAQSNLANGALREVDAALDSVIASTKGLESVPQLVDPLVNSTVSLTQQLAGSLSSLEDAVSRTDSGITNLSSTIDSLSSSLATLRSSTTWSLIKDLLNVDPSRVHDFMTSPVELEKNSIYPVENYGSGVAPFFTSLALWVGGIALVAIFKLEVDEEDVGPLRPWQAYFGRWLLFILLGALQAVACCAGNLVIGIQCENPALYFLSAIVASFCFVNIIYALSVAFKHVGKALAFTLIILQVPGSSGMYPIEMMPDFFQAVGPWLPFTYSNNAMREALFGAYNGNFVRNLGMLLVFVVFALLVGVTARGHLVNVNALFDRRLRETDHLMVSEPFAQGRNRFRLATVVKAVHKNEEYRAVLEERSASFERAYPKLVRRGIACLLLLPLGLFVLMLASVAKLQILAVWIVSIIVLYAFLIFVEYYHDRIGRKKALTELSADERMEVLRETLREEPFAVAPVDAIIERHAQRRKGGDE